MRIAILAYCAPTESLDGAIDDVRASLERQDHEVRVISFYDDLPALVAELRSERFDLVFNLAENFGADVPGGLIGMVGVLDLLQLPYTGSGPGEIFLQEDKALTKKLLSYEQLPCPDFAAFWPDAGLETGGKLRMPLFVKPLRSDASIGIDAKKSIIHNTTELFERVAEIHREFKDAALAEEYIVGREFYVGVLGNQKPQAFPPIEMDFSGLPPGAEHVMDNAAKFAVGTAEYQGTHPKVAEIDDELRSNLQQVAVRAYQALRLCDYGRVDLRMTADGRIYVIEVNANCYLESSGEFAMGAAAMGLDYDALIGKITELAFERQRPVEVPAIA